MILSKNYKKHFVYLIVQILVLLRKYLVENANYSPDRFSIDDLWRVMQNLGENLTKNDVEEMMREADRDLDGRISFAEFIEMIRPP
jgi:hypothetical protein